MARKGRGGDFGYSARAASANRWAASERRRRAAASDRAERQRRGGGGWTPRGSQNPDVGVIAGTDEVVSFKTGGLTGDQTLIADGDFSEGDGTGAAEARTDFDGPYGDRHHNHYGSDAGGDGYFSEDRGYYTGPDH